jgi:hypothetical protein
MQAQLLSTVPPRAIDIGDGHAANDGNCVPSDSEFEQPRTVSALEAVRTPANEDDEYWLGGYAGI